MVLLRLSNTGIRSAIRRNLVSFPSGIPVFPKQTRCDIQWRIGQLYFVMRCAISPRGMEAILVVPVVAGVARARTARAVPHILTCCN
jgi:hypothetical protein